MPVSRTRRPQGGNFGNEYGSSFSRRYSSNNDNSRDLAGKFREHVYNVNNDETIYVPSLKKRKFSASGWENSGRYHWQSVQIGDAPSTSNSLFLVPKRADTSAYTHTSHKRDHSKLEDDVIFMSRDEIERCSPSRKDGIDSVRETHLRYSYCAFLQNLGMRLDLPQTTIGTAMVLCHRFFVRRSHACHDRFLIATAALFLAAKSEETPRPLNNVLRASCEICHKQDLTFFSYLLPVDWFEQYRERVTEAEQMILTTLDFELNVHHPYVPLTSVLNKLGLSQSVLVNLALNLVSEGVLGLGSARPDFMQNIYELVLQGSPDSVGLCWVGCASRSDPTFCPSRFLTPYSTKLVKFEGQLAYLPKKTSLAVDWLEVRRLKEIGAKNIIDLRSL